MPVRVPAGKGREGETRRRRQPWKASCRVVVGVPWSLPPSSAALAPLEKGLLACSREGAALRLSPLSPRAFFCDPAAHDPSASSRPPPSIETT